MKFNGAKTRLSRRLGVALSPKAQRIMEKRPDPPGQHGASTQLRMSDFAIQLRVGRAAADVKLDDRFECRNAAVVHVGCRASDLSQRRRLECAAVVGDARHPKPPLVGKRARAPRNPRVVESLV